MRTFLIPFLVVFIYFLNGVNTYAQPTQVDSVYNLIQGDWYKVIEYQGFTGIYDTVYSEEVYHIERIARTDSLTWTVRINGSTIRSSRYVIAYIKSQTRQLNVWMLLTSGGHMMIDRFNGCVMYYLDAWDGGGEGYSRNQLLGTRNPIADRTLFFPNPVQSTLVVGQVDEVRIVDLNGRMVKAAVSPSNGMVDVSSLKQGVYLVQVLVKGAKWVGKMVKE